MLRNAKVHVPLGKILKQLREKREESQPPTPREKFEIFE